MSIQELLDILSEAEGGSRIKELKRGDIKSIDTIGFGKLKLAAIRKYKSPEYKDSYDEYSYVDAEGIRYVDNIRDRKTVGVIGISNEDFSVFEPGKVEFVRYIN